jgi:hypothetical protein
MIVVLLVVLCIPVASFIGAVAGWTVVFPVALLFHAVRGMLRAVFARRPHIRHG